MFDRLLHSFGKKDLPSFTDTHIVQDRQSRTRDEALLFIAKQMELAGYIRSAEGFSEDLQAREIKSSTGFKDQIATPHAKSKQVLNAGIWVVHFDHELAWDTMDGKPVKTAVALAIPAKSSESVMLPLIAISRANMKADFRQTLNEGSSASIFAAVSTAIGGTL